MKTCSRCNKDKPLHAFSKDRSLRCGLRSSCKECCQKYRTINKEKDKEYHSTYYTQNRSTRLEKGKQWRDQNPEKVKILASKHKETRKNYNNRKRRELKLEVYAHYGSVCANPDCADPRFEVLTIDHVNNDGSSLRKIHGTGLSLYSWIIKHNFPVDFQLLCWNCNLSKYHYGCFPPKRTV